MDFRHFIKKIQGKSIRVSSFMFICWLLRSLKIVYNEMTYNLPKLKQIKKISPSLKRRREKKREMTIWDSSTIQYALLQ